MANYGDQFCKECYQKDMEKLRMELKMKDLENSLTLSTLTQDELIRVIKTYESILNTVASKMESKEKKISIENKP